MVIKNFSVGLTMHIPTGGDLFTSSDAQYTENSIFHVF